MYGSRAQVKVSLMPSGVEIRAAWVLIQSTFTPEPLMRSRRGPVRRCATPSSFSSRSCLSRMIVSVTVDPAERIWRLNSCGEMRLAVHWRPERTCDG